MPGADADRAPPLPFGRLVKFRKILYAPLTYHQPQRRRRPNPAVRGRIGRRFRFMTSRTIRHYLQFKDFSLDDYE